MSNLPPGVTDQMIDDHVNGPPCEECGHFYGDHYEPGEEEMNADGEIERACDIVGCECKGFVSVLVKNG